MARCTKFKVGALVQIPSNFNLRQHRYEWARIQSIWGNGDPYTLLTLELLVSRQIITCGIEEIGAKRALNSKDRYAILERDGFRCQLCGRGATDGIALEVDHKQAYSRGGKTALSNLWTLCHECNSGKGIKETSK